MNSLLTEDTLLGGAVRLLQPRRGYRVAVDAVLLAAAIAAKAGERVLDLGAGVGSVGLCIAYRVPDCRVVGIELQTSLYEIAERNTALNGLQDRISTVQHDLAHPLPAGLGLFDHVATNPPYLPAAVADPSPDRSKALATVESSAGLARWLEAASAATKSAGTLTIIHRLDRLEEIVGLLGRLGFGDIATKTLPPAARVLVQARRSKHPTRRTSPPLVLHRTDGGYTDDAEAILRHGASLAI
jgi:tRNA1(Val) A37 N6-methylase TrmN6